MSDRSHLANLNKKILDFFRVRSLSRQDHSGNYFPFAIRKHKMLTREAIIFENSAVTFIKE